MPKTKALDKHVQREMDAMAIIYDSLRKLEPKAQRWVLKCVMDRLGIEPTISNSNDRETVQERPLRSKADDDTPPDTIEPTPSTVSGASEGISPIASKWMVRNGFTAASLSSLYSLGLDEIDLVAKSIPGRSKNERTRSVFLLQGVASYLSTGVARMTHDKVKEACLHYDAWDSDNFARYMRNLSREVGGNRESGYMLTAAGLSAATEMLKELFSGDDEENPRPKKRKRRGSVHKRARS